ncbi:hypothetical protein [Actinoplanes auranticolor]|nr:hypothetical protein [Actinoplanes auranticolor]
MLVEVIGYKPVSEWDLEELGRGRPKNSDGSFPSGGKPKWITPMIEAERKKRLAEATHDALMAHSDAAMRVLGELVDDPKTPANVRMQIAMFLYEQQHGKAASKVSLDATIGPRQAIASAIVLDDGLPQGHLTIEGELAEVDEDETEADRAMIGLDDD